MDYSLLLIVFSKKQYDEEGHNEANGFINFNLKGSIQSFSPQSLRESKERKDIDEDQGPDIKPSIMKMRPCSEFIPPPDEP